MTHCNDTEGTTEINREPINILNDLLYTSAQTNVLTYKDKESQMFFDRYVISKSLADGHCLLHSIVKSVPNQVGVNISMVDLVKNIETETVLNKDKYSVVYENRSYEILFEEMRAYTQSKIYKSL